jgi:hypothetical protein
MTAISTFFGVFDPLCPPKGGLYARSGDVDDIAALAYLDKKGRQDGYVTRVWVPQENEVFAFDHWRDFPNLDFVQYPSGVIDGFERATDVLFCAPVEAGTVLAALVAATDDKTYHLQGGFDGYNYKASAPAVQAALRGKNVVQYSTLQTNRVVALGELKQLVTPEVLAAWVAQYAVAAPYFFPLADAGSTYSANLPKRLFTEDAGKKYAGNSLGVLLQKMDAPYADKNKSWRAAAYLLGRAPSSEDPTAACAEALGVPAAQEILGYPQIKAYLQAKNPDSGGVPLEAWGGTEDAAKLKVGLVLLVLCGLDDPRIQGIYKAGSIPTRFSCLPPLTGEEMRELQGKPSSSMWDLVLVACALNGVDPGRLEPRAQAMEGWLKALIF